MNAQLLEPPSLSHVIPTRSTRHPYLLMLGAAVTFATMSACTHGLKDRCDWRLVAIARAGLAFWFTALIARQTGVCLVFRWPRTLWMRSVVGSISMLFSFYALSQLPIATCVTFFNTFPLWVTLLAWPVLGERPGLGISLALLCGIVGVAFMEFGQDLFLQPHEMQMRGATLAALIAAICTAIVMLGLHRLRHIDSLAIVVHFSAVATTTAILYTIVTVASGQPLERTRLAEPATLALLAGVGVFATMGQIAMTRAFSVGSPQKLAIVGLSQVVVALGFDFGIWHRSPDAWAAAGIILVIAPVAWLIGRRPQP